MNNNPDQDMTWRKLDNTAKIFPLISTKKSSSVFRLSSVLKEDIDSNLLMNALNLTLEEFSAFKVRIKKGFFWYYLETNPKSPIIEKENTYPCKYIYKSENNDYLFRVSYYHRKINFEVFHAITDATGAISFLKELTYNYINLKHGLTKKETLLLHAEDSYIKNYTKQAKERNKMSRAYIVKGKNLPLYAINVIHGYVDLDLLLKKCREHKVTITEYLTTLLIYSIYKGSYLKSRSKKAIKIYIPVNLRKYMDSSTISNFFSFITIERSFNKERFTDFDELLKFVSTQFKSKLKKDSLKSKISYNVAAEQNLFLRLAPLFLKKIGSMVGNLELSKHHTTTLSNIGSIDVEEKYKEYIDNFLFLGGASSTEVLKFFILSYKNKLTLTFTTGLEDTNIQQIFFTTLVKHGIAVDIESNGAYNDKM